MVQSIDAVDGKNCKSEFFYDPLEQYMETSYSKIHIAATKSYTGTKNIDDFLLARELTHKKERRAV